MYYQQDTAFERRKQIRKTLGRIVELVVILIIIGILVAIIHPVFQQARDIARCSNSQENAKIIGIALAMYSDGNDGTLPPAERWGTALQPMVDEYFEERYQNDLKRVKQLKRDGVDSGPAVKSHFNIVKWSRDPFAMNRSLSGVNLKAIKHPEQTVAFFETTERKPNLSGDQSIQLPPYGERKCNIFVMADGSVKISEHAKDGSIRLVDRHGKPVTIRWEP